MEMEVSMRSNARFVMFAILTAMLFAFAFQGDAAAKKIKLTREEAAALVTKFKTANPEVIISEALTDPRAKGYDEKFYKNLVVNIKNWEIQSERAADAALAADRREKAKSSADKRVETIRRACAEAAEKLAKAAMEPAAGAAKSPEAEGAALTTAAGQAAQPSATAVQGSTTAPEESKKEVKKSKVKKAPKESEPEKYQPKTDRGQKIKELILGK